MLRAVILGAVQGLTEFVPVSSSAHLVLVPFLLGWGTTLGSDLSFDVAVHLGTALAVAVYFARDLWAILRGAALTAARKGGHEDRAFAKLAGLIALATIPAALVGFTLEDPIERAFESPALVALLLLGTAALLTGSEWLYRRKPLGRRAIDGVRKRDAVVIGLMQAVAILPGISRSGATISGGIWAGMTREAAARFSFLLALPAILGAAIVSLPDLDRSIPLSWVVGASIAAFATGIASIAFLLRYLRTNSMIPFAVYCVVLSAISLVAVAVR